MNRLFLNLVISFLITVLAPMKSSGAESAPGSYYDSNRFEGLADSTESRYGNYGLMQRSFFY